MLILYRTYRFRPKLTGYKRDLCNKCEEPRILALVKTYDIFAPYFIPLVPLGYRKRWYCTICRHPAYDRYRTRTGIKVLALITVGLVTLMAGTGVIVGGPDALPAFGVSVLCVGLIVVLVKWIRSGVKRPSIEDLREEVRPLDESRCRLCNEHLLDVPYLHCPHCNLKVFGNFFPDTSA